MMSESDTGGGSSAAGTADLVDTLVQAQNDFSQGHGKETQERNEFRSSEKHWAQTNNWVTFDDISGSQPIRGEDSFHTKGPDDDGLSCLRPPPLAIIKPAAATTLPTGEVNGVPQPAREITTQGHWANQPTAQLPPNDPLGTQQPQDDLLGTQQAAADPLRTQGTPDDRLGTQPPTYNPQLHSSVAQYTTNPFTSADPVQWLPQDSHRCHEAIRHYTVCTTSQNVQMNEMRPLYNVPVVEQPQPVEKGWGGRISPGKPPSNAYLFFTIIAAFISIFLCLCTGLAAFVVALQATVKRTDGRNAEARQKLAFSLALSVASLFIFAPTVIVIVLTQL